MNEPARRKSVTITPERWQRLQDLFERALPLDADGRARLLDVECASDPPLRDQVRALLLASTGDDGALEQRVDRAIAGTMRSRELQPGERVGRYRIVRPVGRGGMGSVYYAERADDQYQQSVALKVVDCALAFHDLAGRLRAERQILAGLEHAHIARLLDGGEMQDGTPFLVMEYVAGTRIDHYCSEHRLDIRSKLRLMQQVCAAVQYAHQHLVVHRDLKPSNILVTPEQVPKLLDFGIAKVLNPDSSATSSVTQFLDRVLTPDHASPEQLLGRPVGTSSDIFALGVLLYELLSGAHPHDFSGLSVSEIAGVVSTSNPSPPSTKVATEPGRRALAAQLQGDLDNIVLKAMHRDPERRYPTATALSQDIQNYLDGRPVLARPDTWTYRSGKFLRRNLWAVTASSFAVFAIAALSVFYTTRLAQERDVAQRERQAADSVAEFMIDVFRRANPIETSGEEVTVRDALDAAAARIDRDLPDQPRLRLALMRKMGQSYIGLGLMPQALALLEQQASIAREQFGDHDPELARALEALGHVRHSMSRFSEAGEAFQQAEKIRQSPGLPRDEEWVRLMHSVATNLRAQQRFEEAIVYHKRAETGARALAPAHATILGHVLQGFAATYAEAGDYSSAERYAREALPMLEGAIHEGYDLYANGLNTLATALRRQYKLDEAESLFRSFVARQVAILGQNHFLVARAQNNLANVLRAKGDYAGAEQALLEALRIYSTARELNLLDMGIAHHNLGAVYHEAGDLPRASSQLDEALALKRKMTGLRSPQVVSTLLEKAAVLRERGDLAAAKDALREAQEVAAEKFDRNDRRHALLTLETGQFHLALGQYDAAAEKLRDAIAALRGQEEPGRLADALCALAELHTATGQIDSARSLLDEALTVRRRIMPQSHPAVVAVQQRLKALRAQ